MATSTTVVEPTTTTATTTTTIVDPNSTTTTVDPNATSTTVAQDVTTTTTVDPNATSTTVAAPPEDLDSAPMLPPVEAPGGRTVMPAGAVETGQMRAITFPVAGPVTYSNDFGACRDGCRRAHKGNDLIGDRLQPLLAMHDGVVDRVLDHPTAGFGIVIRDAEGWEYHIYHVNNDRPGTDDGADDGTWRFATGIVPGSQVTAGQLIGWMGDSGNSEGSVPHAHVEIHRPDGEEINPFWSLRQAQRDVNCAAGTVATDPATADPAFLETGWTAADLPDGWQPLTLTGGRPGSRRTAARMWVSPSGLTPVDAAALRVGDARFDVGVDCSAPPAAPPAPAIPAEVGAILATIRAMESGGDYTVSSTSSSASGAYQFVDSTWGGYGGYRRAKDAPPPVQDAKAAEQVTSILARNGGDVRTVSVSWYLGHVPVGDEFDRVPPFPGNRLTPREYQNRWMQRYFQLLGMPEASVGAGSAWTPVDTSMTCQTAVVDLGPPGEPQYVLTQAQGFVATPSGRAVPKAVDPCDPARTAPLGPAATESVAVTRSRQR